MPWPSGRVLNVEPWIRMALPFLLQQRGIPSPRSNMYQKSRWFFMNNLHCLFPKPICALKRMNLCPSPILYGKNTCIQIRLNSWFYLGKRPKWLHGLCNDSEISVPLLDKQATCSLAIRSECLAEILTKYMFNSWPTVFMVAFLEISWHYK